jgi:cytoskeletal protein RodZ
VRQQTFRVTYPPFDQQPARPTGRGWFLVLGAAVLGVFVFCGIVVAAAGSGKDPDGSRDVSRTGALVASPPASGAASTQPATATSDAAPTSDPAPTSPPTLQATTAPTTKAPTTKAPTTKAPTTKAPTKPAGTCNPNYSPCVPNDPMDVDCKGGGGNGPSYVTGPVTVTGSDVYGLDKDGDGIGCE